MRILLIALLAVAAFPAAADAATVSRTDGTLRYQAGKGERISGSVTETSSGAFVARSDKSARQRLDPWRPAASAGGQREIRCAGQGVARVEISLKRARTSTFRLEDVHVAVAAVGSPGANTMSFTRTPDFTYDGGPKRDDVEVRDSPGGHSTIRLGAGADFFDGQPPALYTPDSTATFTVDGGPGRDYLMGGPGADSLAGGPGSDSLVTASGRRHAHRRLRDRHRRLHEFQPHPQPRRRPDLGDPRRPAQRRHRRPERPGRRRRRERDHRLHDTAGQR